MKSPLIVALDTSDREHALALAKRLAPVVGTFKIGLQLYTAHGPDVVRAIAGQGVDVFLDLKFHDIPNTVAGAVYSTGSLPGVRLMTLHAGGGKRMMAAAAAMRAEMADRDPDAPRLLGVTVLTSMGTEDLREVGVSQDPATQVEHLARLACASGLDGVVCSPLEVSALRQTLGPDVLLVTPGIRPPTADTGDQKRVATPAAALAAGASMIVVGRPITAARDPLEAARQILDSLA